MPRIAVDAMGGDFAPEEVVKGVAKVSLESDIEMVLVGSADRIQQEGGVSHLGERSKQCHLLSRFVWRSIEIQSRRASPSGPSQYPEWETFRQLA